MVKVLRGSKVAKYSILLFLTANAIALSSCFHQANTHTEAPLAKQRIAIHRPASDSIKHRGLSYHHEEYMLPNPLCRPVTITEGADRFFWFTEKLPCGALGRINSSGEIREFSVGSNLDMRFPDAIAAGSDNTVWFAAGNRIGRITSDGVISSCASLGKQFFVNAIRVDAKNAVWFSGYARDATFRAIGRLDRDCKPHMVLRLTSIALDIAIASGDVVWFSSQFYPRIGRFQVGGRLRWYPISAPAEGICASDDGSVWFSEFRSLNPAGTDLVGRISRSGQLTEFTVSDVDLIGVPIACAKNRVWVAGMSKILEMSNAGIVGVYWPKSPRSIPMSIAPARDGSIWFTEYNLHAIGHISMH